MFGAQKVFLAEILVTPDGFWLIFGFPEAWGLRPPLVLGLRNPRSARVPEAQTKGGPEAPGF